MCCLPFSYIKWTEQKLSSWIKNRTGAEGNSLSQLDWKNAKPQAFWSEITISDSNGLSVRGTAGLSQLSGLEAAAFWVNEKPEIFMIANNNI